MLEQISDFSDLKPSKVLEDSKPLDKTINLGVLCECLYLTFGVELASLTQ